MALASWVLKTSKDGEATASLGYLCQCHTTLLGEFLLTSSPTCLLLLLLPSLMTKKTSALPRLNCLSGSCKLLWNCCLASLLDKKKKKKLFPQPLLIDSKTSGSPPGKPSPVSQHFSDGGTRNLTPYFRCSSMSTKWGGGNNNLPWLDCSIPHNVAQNVIHHIDDDSTFGNYFPVYLHQNPQVLLTGSQAAVPSMHCCIGSPQHLGH